MRYRNGDAELRAKEREILESQDPMEAYRHYRSLSRIEGDRKIGNWEIFNIETRYGRLRVQPISADSIYIATDDSYVDDRGRLIPWIVNTISVTFFMWFRRTPNGEWWPISEDEVARLNDPSIDVNAGRTAVNLDYVLRWSSGRVSTTRRDGGREVSDSVKAKIIKMVMPILSDWVASNELAIMRADVIRSMDNIRRTQEQIDKIEAEADKLRSEIGISHLRELEAKQMIRRLESR